MHVIIAEKDMLARDIARALCGIPVSEDAKLPLSGNGYTVCACSGHLLELKEPQEIDGSLEAWNLSNLPIFFFPWPKAPTSVFAKNKLETIRSLLGGCDGLIYHAGDPDDEGQLIVDEVLEYFGFDPASSQVQRVYVNDSIEKNIIKAFENAKPNAQCVQDGQAALARQLADFSFGTTETRLASIKLHTKLPVGRVQTPTLRLVVERDLAREGHKAREFFELHVQLADQATGATFEFKYNPPEGMFEDGKHCFDKSYLEQVAQSLQGLSNISFEISHAAKTLPAPLPFNLTTLTSDMGKRFKMSPEGVMEITQSLRDDFHAITYNRTDSSYLKEEHFTQAPDVTSIVQTNLGSQYLLDTTIHSKAFDDSKVSAHHGIIPQEIAVPLSRLSEAQRQVYEAIALRYLCLFMPDLSYTEAKAEFSIEGIDGTFNFSAKKLLRAGWAGVAPAEWQTVKGLGESIPDAGAYSASIVSSEIKAKLTSPPKAFTSDSLVVAMANIARYVKDPQTREILKKKDENSTDGHGSIGTTATRASIVASLIEHGYLNCDKKTQVLTSTSKARRFIEIIPQEISSADLSARWWLTQQQVKAGELGADAIMADVCREYEQHKDSAYEGKTIQEVVGTCPKCGHKLIAKAKSIQCETNKYRKNDTGEYSLEAGCGYSFYPFIFGKKLTSKQAGDILSGKTIVIKGATSNRTGKKFDCKAKLGPDGKIEAIFDKAPKKQASKKRINI